MSEQLTNEQMLKELASKGIKGKWKPKKPHYTSSEFVQVNVTDSCKIWCHYGKEAKATFQILHVPDLIDDDEFMKAVCGEEERSSGACTYPRYQVIQRGAIILSGDAQVKYLHQMMKGGE